MTWTPRRSNPLAGVGLHHLIRNPGRHGAVRVQQPGRVPTGKVRYDKLKAAVARVLGFSRARVETERWTAGPTATKSEPAT